MVCLTERLDEESEGIDIVGKLFEKKFKRKKKTLQHANFQAMSLYRF